MPVHRCQDSKGPYYQWGNHGAKYYYIPKDKKSRDSAYKKAVRQAMAIFAHGYRGK